MDKQERKTVVAVRMELSDMIEKLSALHEYLTDYLNSEGEPNEQRRNNVYSRIPH